jgi:phospholipid/cholesterol/gamma-HCH transport system permease protein
VPRVLFFMADPLKKAAQEVQEYVHLVAAACRAAVSRPWYRDDIIEQFDLIGIGSMTVVLLTGFFTGAVLALQSGLTLDPRRRRPSSARLRAGPS